MIISHKYKFVFIKTRKTGGSTIEKILRPLLGKDDVCTGSNRDNTPPLNIQSGEDGHQPEFIPKGYWSFSIERNPWDKVVSSYYFHTQAKPDIFKGFSFETYINFILKHKLFLPCDWSIYQNVEKIYQYTNLKEILIDLNNKYNLNIDLDLINTIRCKSEFRKVTDYKELHTPTTKALIEKQFKNEIETFNYIY